MSVVDSRSQVPGSASAAAGGATAAPWLALPERSALRSARKFLGQNPRIPFFAGVWLVIMVICLLAPVLAPYGEREVNTRERMQGPSADHWMGTDQLGRDTFSRVLYGGRVSIPLGMLAVVIAASIGIAAGVISGYFGGWGDQILGRLCDAQQAFPELILALAIVAALGQSLLVVIVVLSLGAWPAYYRLARGQVLQARELEYVNAARAMGASELRMMVRHILPNITNPLIIATSLAAGGAVLLQSNLGFFGLGPAAGTADWGSMFFDGLNNFRIQPWLVVGPGLAVFISVLAFYQLGDALRDALDPYLRNRRAGKAKA